VILEASGVTFQYDSTPVLSGVNMRLEPGITAIIGPNAAGKSTLLKCLSGLLKPEGQIELEGQPIHDLETRELAQSISYLPQDFATGAVLTVFEAVLLGRVHQLGWRVTDADMVVVENLLNELRITDLAGRDINELSDGQQQLVVIAQALAREPKVLLLDEPTSNLDLHHQFEVCGLIRKLTRSRGICTAMALHDLNLASRYADQIYVVRGGAIYSAGEPAHVLTPELIADVYRVQAEVKPGTGDRPVVTVLGPVETEPGENG
jgi:iron complex transport system ATP-binding protein